MSTQTKQSTAYGIGGTGDWILGGSLGGVVGSLTFGLLLWVVDPEIITDAIPAIYGVEPMGTAGWIFHLVHGLVLGVVFGFLISRDPILGTITADAETGFLAAMGPGLRFVLAGFVYGLAVWAILPVIALSLWTTIGGFDAAEFPAFAFEGLVGHALYGLVLGALFTLVTRFTSGAEEPDAPFRDATEDADSARNRR